MIDYGLKTNVLRCSGGPCWLIVINGEVVGLEVTQTGQQSSYQRYLDAAEDLVREGLLSRGGPRRGLGVPYSFTELGKIAYWAIGEAARREADRKSGRAA